MRPVCRLYGALNGSDGWAYRGAMTDMQSRVSDVAWQWKNNQQGYDDWINTLLRDTPEVWEASEGAAEDIITNYVRHLERLVIAAYGPHGLEPDHEGVASAIVAFEEMNAIIGYMDANFPETHARQDPAKAVIRLLGVVQSIAAGLAQVVHAVVPVVNQSVQMMKNGGLIKNDVDL